MLQSIESKLFYKSQHLLLKVEMVFNLNRIYQLIIESTKTVIGLLWGKCTYLYFPWIGHVTENSEKCIAQLNILIQNWLI